MSFHRLAETIFTLIMLLFVGFFVLAILVAVSVVQELGQYEVSGGAKFAFIFGMFLVFFFIMKMFAGKIRDYHRYSND